MLKILSFTGMFCLLLTLHATAQKNADAATVKQLIAKNAVALGLSAEDVVNTRVSSSYYDAQANAIMAYLQQTYKGVDVYNAITPVAFRDDKVVTYTASRIAADEKNVLKGNAVPTIKPLTALRNAAADIQSPIAQQITIPLRQTPDGQEFEYDKVGIGFNNLMVRLMWVPVGETGQLQLAWQVTIHTLKSNDLWSIKVDANTGKILHKENLTNKEVFKAVNLAKLSCFEPVEKFNGETSETGIQAVNSAKYNVIPYPYEDPNFSAPVLVTNPWTIFPNTSATTLKWNSDGIKDYDSTKGNNVYAQPDVDANDATFSNATRSSTALPDLTFNPIPNLTSGDPGEDSYTKFAITNLFYWNNIMHDMAYQYGFDEPSGNFQINNQGRGGLGNDYVIADGQDASGLNNANFATPADGSSPRMQMFLWGVSATDTMLKVNSPGLYAGFKPAAESSFSTNNKLVKTGPITGNVVFYQDFEKATHLACTPPENALNGLIAYIDRADCNFTVKVKNAQDNGAIAVIVGDNVVSNLLVLMGGTDNSITIPAIFIFNSEAVKLKSYLNAGTTVNVTLSHNEKRYDGDLDNGIVAHEYTHGISNRLTGGPANVFCLTNKEQMGEGWSDYFAMMVTTDWSKAKVTDGSLPRPIGNYAIGATPEYGGIRYYPYSTDFSVNPWTYDSLATSALVAADVHAVGEVWCNMLWEMTWELAKDNGINTTFMDASKTGANSIAMKLVMQGMKLQKCSPGFVDGRLGILKADTLLFAGKYSAAIWKAFARRGLGYSASQGNPLFGSNVLTDGIAAYDLPPSVLPATWGSFTAEKANNTAVLKWSTLTEINVDRFAVEKTIDGRNYTEVGTVKAKGNSTLAQSYTLTDLKPVKGNNIYRIRLIDRDSKSNYSESRSLNFGDIKNLISLSPNPSRSKVVLTVKDNQKLLQVKLFNSLGEQVAAYKLTSESMPLDISRFATGSYYISVTGEGINQREKLIIQ